MQNKKYKVSSLEQTNQVAIDIVSHLQPDAIVLLHGNLGAGKTTLIQHMGKYLGVKAHMSSPTFNLLNQYRGRLQNTIVEVFHLDLYRVRSNDSIIDLNFFELSRFERFIAFVEWPEKANTDWGHFGANLYNLHINPLFNDHEIDLEKIEREITFEF